jgi:rubrerythrin
MSQLPPGAPETVGAAFAHINAVVDPTIDDLKLMVFLEASGQTAYEDLARSAPNAEISRLLLANAREELAHAHRVSKVIKQLTGEDFPPPSPEDNPYATSQERTVDRQILDYLVVAEDHGATLYETWARHTADTRAAQLLRLNAEEETLHGQRAAQAITFLEA